MPSKDMIGRVLSTGSATVDAAHVAAFAHALGDPSPEYATLAPPTYPIAFMSQAMAGGMDTFLELGLNFMTLVHGEQEFEIFRPLRPGATYLCRSKVLDLYEKTGKTGPMGFVVRETSVTDANNEIVAKMRSVTVVRL